MVDSDGICKGHNKGGAAVTEPHTEEVGRCSLAGNEYSGGSPIDLGGFARGEGQRDVDLRVSGPELRYQAAHRGFGVMKIFLVPQSLIDPVGGMMLFFRGGLVLLKALFYEFPNFFSDDLFLALHLWAFFPGVAAQAICPQSVHVSCPSILLINPVQDGSRTGLFNYQLNSSSIISLTI